MTKEELEKATGQELIEQRDYCGVDGYYGDYLDNVNAEMLKRFNRLADLENKIADIKANCDLAIEGRDIKIKELEKENAELDMKRKAERQIFQGIVEKKNEQLTKAKEIILKLYNAGRDVLMCRAEEKAFDNLEKAINDRIIEQFLKEIEK